ncbi:hypothetical protein OROMI_000253 [Orobanche minor]
MPSQEILKIRDGTHLEAEMSSQEILKIRDGTHLEAEGILTYRKRPSQEILKIRDGTPLEAEGILTYGKRPSKLLEILKIRDGTPLEAEVILTYRKRLSKLLEPSQEILKIRDGTLLEMPSQEILKIRDGTPLEAELDVPSNVVQKIRVARILVFKIRSSQEILKIRDGTHLEAEGILTYRKGPRNCSVWHFSSKLDVPSNVVQKKRVARIMVFKIRPSQEILKIRDGTPLEAEGILTYRKRPSKLLEILKIRDGTPLEAEGILTYRKRSSQEILKIRDGTHLEAEGILTYRKRLDVPSNVVQKIRVARILVFKIRSSQEILKIRDGTHLEAEGILTYRKGPRNCSVWHFSSKLDVPSNVVQKKRVARILVFKIRPSQEILKIRDGTPLETEGILTYRKRPLKLLVARIMVFKIRPSQEILKIRDGTPLEAEGILTYRKRPSKLLGSRNCSVWHFSIKLDVPSNVVQKIRVARILVLKIRSSQEILKIRDGTHLEAEGILTYRKGPRNCSVWHFSSKLDVPSNVVQKKRVARIMVFKIRPSQEILKIRDGTPLEAEGILTYRKRPSKLLGLALFYQVRCP